MTTPSPLRPPCSPAEIRARLAGFTPDTSPSAQAARVAAVAMVLRAGEVGLEALFMQRAARAEDPWSGQMAFPGGHVDPDDATVEAAARRETLEEVGLALTPEMVIGRLSDVTGGRLRTFDLAVCPLVYFHPAPGPLSHNHEVADTVWVPLRFLGDPGNIGDYYFPGDPEQRPFPCFHYGPYPIWGLTYRMIAQFMGLFGIQLPAERPITNVE